MCPAPLISLNAVSVRLADRCVIEDISWQIRWGEHWVIRGPNGAGKSTLARTLMGQTAIVAGTIARRPLPSEATGHRLPSLAMVSSEQYHQIYDLEQHAAERRAFSGRIHQVTRAADDLGVSLSGETLAPLLAAMPEIAGLVEKPVEALSSGEMRKLLIFRAVSTHPDLLILDEPYNGLDGRARQSLSRLLDQLHEAGTQMVLVTHRPTDIADFFTHALDLSHGRVIRQGPITTKRSPSPADEDLSFGAQTVVHGAGRAPDHLPKYQSGNNVLIHMDGVTVRYKNVIVLDKVSWEMKVGEHWAIVGPNGAGKTTLLKLITGENLQGYANRIMLFGRPKGTGESIWDIRRRIGYVADDLQARYQKRLKGVDVVCSGFFDSVGLYTATTETQRHDALDWMTALGIADLATRPVNRLSYGQQRLLLIARAMVKTPRLLILDEPCNGLDPDHRQQVLTMLARIAQNRRTHLLYVTHRPEEMPGSITHCLYLESGRVTAIRAKSHPV